MRRKGQAEIALILGLVLIAVIIGVYSYSSLIPPSIDQVDVTDEQRGTYTFVTDLLRGGSESTISTLYQNGGYLSVGDATHGFVRVNGFGNVAYRQMCENYENPDVVANFKTGLLDYITQNLPASQVIGGRSVVFNKNAMNVDTTVYDNRIVVSATIPTTVQGVQMLQPYRVEVSTGLGRVSKFADNFARMEADCRMLETHLMFSLMQSSEFSPDWIPFGTGNAHRTYRLLWGVLSERMEKYIIYSLSQTEIGGQIPVTDEGKLADFKYRGWDGSAMEFFPIEVVFDYTGRPADFLACQEPYPNIEGDRYEDLSNDERKGIKFTFGLNDGLDESTFSAPQYLEIKPKTGRGISAYLSPFGLRAAEYAQFYSVRYPVVVGVWDELSGEQFKFAVHAYMENNAPGMGCTVLSPIAPPIESGQSAEHHEYCAEDVTNFANLAFVYTDGSIVRGATVTYNDCPLGTTGNDGIISAPIPEQTLLGELGIEVDENEYIRCYDPDVGNVVIPLSANYRFNFNTVEIDDTNGDGDYEITGINPVTAGTDYIIQVELGRPDTEICDPNIGELAGNWEGSELVSSVVFPRRLPVEDYNVSINVQSQSSREGLGYVEMNESDFGLFTPTYTDAGISDIYVYAPVVEDFQNADVDIKLLFENCNIDPLTETMHGGSC